MGKIKINKQIKSKNEWKKVSPQKIKKNKTVKVTKVNDEIKNDELIENVQSANDVKTPGLFVKRPVENEYVSFDNVKAATVALLKLQEQQNASKKLLENEEPIFLQITSLKVPKCPRRIMRFLLPHSLVTELSEVCLFVKDLKRGRRVDHDPTIIHYEDYLRSKGITCIKGVVPLHQVKVEYDQFELKRRLLSQYDYFLADSKIAGHLFHLLGKTFIKKRRNPTPVRMEVDNLKSEIDKALRKVPLYINSNGDSHLVQIGHTQQKINHISENIIEIIQCLVKSYPGGWDNIKCLHLKTERSKAVPLYFTLKSKNTIKVPKVKSNKPKACVPVKGELSTLLNREVIVKPGGTVIVKKIKKQKRDFEADDKIMKVEQIQKFKEEEEHEPKHKKIKKSVVDDSDDEEIASVEQMYLKELNAFQTQNEGNTLKNNKKQKYVSKNALKIKSKKVKK